MRALILLLLAIGVVTAAVVPSVPAFAGIPEGTPRFSWSGGPTPNNGYKLWCDGAPTSKATIAAGQSQWQSAASDWTPGTHSCYLRPLKVGGGQGDPSNTVTFEIAAPELPLTLSVE